MKKIFILLIPVLLFVSQFSLAQDTAGEFGIKAGMNLNDLGGKNAGYFTSVGFNVGFYYEAVINSFASIQPELLFSLQGAALDLNKDFRLNYYYLNVPVLAKFYFAEDFDFEIGPQYGYLVSASETSPFGNLNITENVRRSDFSIVFGIGYKYKGRTSLNVRYDLGITNTNFQDVVYSQRLTNRVFMISLAYIL